MKLPAVLKILINLNSLDKKDFCISDISKKSNITYSHSVKIVNILISKGLLSNEKIGRKNIIKLSDKGKKISDNLLKLENYL